MILGPLLHHASFVFLRRAQFASRGPWIDANKIKFAINLGIIANFGSKDAVVDEYPKLVQNSNSQTSLTLVTESDIFNMAEVVLKMSVAVKYVKEPTKGLFTEWIWLFRPIHSR